jgi:hypothetical protein
MSKEKASVYESSYDLFISWIDDVPKSDRVKLIDDLIHRLEFERRWQSLETNQIRHMCEEMSESESIALSKCSTDAEKEEMIEMYARSKYFRRCAWMMYLNGESEEPPVKGYKY